MLETTTTTLEVVATVIGLLAAVWAGLRLLHMYYERFLFFSGCHVLPLTLRNDMVDQNPQLKEEMEDHAFRPIIVLPRKLKRYFRVKDGGRVILTFRPPGGDEMIVTAYVYWYPEDPDLWDLFDQPALSLALRRYFGIERPTLGHEDVAPEGWRLIEHGTTRNGREELAIFHRTSEKSGNLVWLVSDKYSARFWLPERNGKGAKYRDEWQNGWFLEYAGISLQVAKPSIFSIRA